MPGLSPRNCAPGPPSNGRTGSRSSSTSTRTGTPPRSAGAWRPSSTPKPCCCTNGTRGPRSSTASCPTGRRGRVRRARPGRPGARIPHHGVRQHVLRQLQFAGLCPRPDSGLRAHPPDERARLCQGQQGPRARSTRPRTTQLLYLDPLSPRWRQYHTDMMIKWREETGTDANYEDVGGCAGDFGNGVIDGQGRGPGQRRAVPRVAAPQPHGADGLGVRARTASRSRCVGRCATSRSGATRRRAFIG